jgi:DnaJ-domain-containing protein 1
MSLGSRIFKVAEQKLMEGLGLAQGAGFRGDPAREELEEFLRDPTPPRRPQAPGATADARSAATPRPEKTPHPCEAEYRLLGVAVGADLQTVQRHWRHLVRENHPDHFAADPEAQRRATERLRRINEVYDGLRRFFETREAGQG